VDDDLKIDFGPDTVAQMQRTGRHLARVRTLLFTHQHSDHLAPRELEWAHRPFTNTPPEQPIAVFGNEAVIGQLRDIFPDPATSNLDLRPPLSPLGSVTTPKGDTILPLPADHGAPGSLVLRVTRARDNRTFFYGHDSGLYPPATLDALADGPPLDVALLDCTNGGQSLSNRGHMGVDGVIRMADEMRARGIATDATRIIATHFSHNGGLLHEELVRAFLPHQIEVAFDGMVVRV
jgi:phosphoribosyl 1,2-cyclic phosphate phosphodiesterase